MPEACSCRAKESESGIAALFHGPSGTGKTLAAEAIGFDLGTPLKVVSCAQLISKWVGESAKNIEAVFDEAKANGALLVFDEAEGLFGHRSAEADGAGGAGRHDTNNVGVLLQRIERHPGVVVVITNLRAGLDAAFNRRFTFIVEFDKPDERLRARLFARIVPPKAPRAPDVDLDALARRYALTGGQIRSVVMRAATRAALRDAARRRIEQDDLTKACEEELEKGDAGALGSAAAMYS